MSWASFGLGFAAACATAAFTLTVTCRLIARKTPAPGNTRVPAPSPVPGQRPPGVAANPPPRPAPAPAGDPHGGVVTTIHRCPDCNAPGGTHCTPRCPRRGDNPDDSPDRAFEQRQAGDHPDGF